MIITRLVFLALTFLVLNGCSIAVKKYEVDPKTTPEIAKINQSFQGVTITGANPELTELVNGKTLSCRWADYELPTNETVKSYLENALKADLEAAKKLSPQGPSIQIVVNQLESHTASIFEGHWDLDFDYHVDKTVVNVKTKALFTSAYFGPTACQNTADALSHAFRANFLSFFQKRQNTNSKP